MYNEVKQRTGQVTWLDTVSCRPFDTEAQPHARRSNAPQEGVCHVFIHGLAKKPLPEKLDEDLAVGIHARRPDPLNPSDLNDGLDGKSWL
jgi:hypothetical protein